MARHQLCIIIIIIIINCVADVVRRGRLRWFGHLERKSVDDWVSACRGLVVEGTRGQGRSRKTWEQCVRDDMKLLGLHPEWAVLEICGGT